MYKYNDLPFFTVCCIYSVLELLVLFFLFGVLCVVPMRMRQELSLFSIKSSEKFGTNTPKRWKTGAGNQARVILRTMAIHFKCLTGFYGSWNTQYMENVIFALQKRLDCCNVQRTKYKQIVTYDKRTKSTKLRNGLNELRGESECEKKVQLQIIYYSVHGNNTE